MKPSIFVSSTVKDLPNEREASKRAVEKLPAIPIMSEFTMNAVDKPSVQACIDEVKKADFYILVLGGRYGWELDNGISITELEYDTAYKEGKPIFVFNLEIEKEEKQQRFAEKAGSQRFWKTIKNAFELEDEIIKSYNQYIKENEYEKSLTKEDIYSNLLEVEFPKSFFIADLNIDRKQIIKDSKTTPKKLKNSASQFEVVISALHQLEIKFPGDWILFENKIITFHDLGNSNFGLSQVIDAGTLEELECEDFYSIDEDHERVFKHLLRKCLGRKLHHMNIKLYKEDGIYVYMPIEGINDRNEKWVGKKEAVRNVFAVKMKKKEPEKIFYCKHFAFRANFYGIDNKWYISITPEWYITFDGKNKSFYGHKQISYLKKKERNAQVLSHIKFISYQLTAQTQDNLFDSSFNYKFLQFKELVVLEASPALTEKDWINNESEKIRDSLLQEELTLF